MHRYRCKPKYEVKLMFSKRKIKKLANNIVLTKLQDYVSTYDVTPTEKLKRSIALTDFWEKEGDKHMRLLKEISKEDEVSFDNFFLNLGYWFRFKLLCEGKEPSIDNILENRLDVHELTIFMHNVLGY